MTQDSHREEDEHSAILLKGVEHWNEWRLDNPGVRPNLFQCSLPIDDLRNANLEDTNLGYLQFEGKDCRGAHFNGASLYSADLRGGNFKNARLAGAKLDAVFLPEGLSSIDLGNCDLRLVLNLNEIDFRDANLEGVNFCGANLQGMNFSGSHLDRSDLRGARFSDANLRGASLRNADLFGADFSGADLIDACLVGANFSAQSIGGAEFSKGAIGSIEFNKDPEALIPISRLGVATSGGLGGLRLQGNFVNTKFNQTDFSKANFAGANLAGADLRGTILRAADLHRADLTESNLDGVDLSAADLRRARMVGTSVRNGRLSGCKIFGISAWKVVDEGAEQKDLVITNSDEAIVVVDNLEVGQFVYLILNNQRIRHVIDTITSKVVLILGRFTDQRKKILDSARAELRDLGYCPVLFDFAKPESRDLTESVSTLAHLARFIIADVTDAKSIPQELQAIVPHLPSVPVQPILAAGQREYGMFEHFDRYSWVLPLVEYAEGDFPAFLRTTIVPKVEAKLGSPRNRLTSG